MAECPRQSALTIVRRALTATCVLGVTVSVLSGSGETAYASIATYAAGLVLLAGSRWTSFGREHSRALLIGGTGLLSAFEVATNVRLYDEIGLVWAGMVAIGSAVVVAGLSTRTRTIVVYVVFQLIWVGIVTSVVIGPEMAALVLGGLVAVDVMVVAVAHLNASAYDRVASTLCDLRDRERELSSALEVSMAGHRAQSAFFAAMSHEFRTPLTAVIGYAQLLKEDIEATTKRQPIDVLDTVQMIQSIEDGGERLLETLNAVLDVSLLEGGSVDVRPEGIDVAAIARKSALEFNERALDSGLHLEVRAPSAVWAHADVDAVRKVVRNLLKNAITYTPEGGIVLEVRAHSTDVEIAVVDSGPGIPEDMVETVFEPFRQVSEGHSRTYEGVGLGLTIARGLAEATGGQLTAKSKLGRGSRFSLRLPASRSEEPSPSVPSAFVMDHAESPSRAVSLAI